MPGSAVRKPEVGPLVKDLLSGEKDVAGCMAVTTPEDPVILLYKN